MAFIFFWARGGPGVVFLPRGRGKQSGSSRRGGERISLSAGLMVSGWTRGFFSLGGGDFFRPSYREANRDPRGLTESRHLVGEKRRQQAKKRV